MFMKRSKFTYLVAVFSLALHFGCGEAEAMGKKHSSPDPVPELPAPTPDRYRQGIDLGRQNGERMVSQIKRATTGVEGCSAQPAYEKALVAVIKAIRPPKPGTGEDLDLARGYYKGYSSAFGIALRSERQECDLSTVVEARLPGTVVGSLLCGAASIDIKLLDLIEVEPIYTGWTGGRRDSHSECGEVAVSISKNCIIGHEEDREKLERTLHDQIALGCAD
jgi:hypothetical protein